MKHFPLPAFILFIFSCKTTPDSNRDYADESKIYKLQLNPATGSGYHYDITNETEFRVEVDDRKTTNRNKTDIGINYEISKDTAGNFVFSTTYDRIHLYSKNGDQETEMDADNASFSVNPLEKMLGPLKTARVTAVVSPTGNLKSSSGYQEIATKILGQFQQTDEVTRSAIEKQWNKLLEEKMLKRNTQELFRLFPDSAVHIGDTWKITSNQNGEVNLVIKNVFKLKDINSNVAIVEAEGEITGDNSSNSISAGNVSSNLKGQQQSQYEVETKTGMLIRGKTKAKIKGELDMMGREVPITIETSVRINGKRLK